jgi:hypothetical protein
MKKAPKRGGAPQHEASLDHLYGRIGISAVAAAARYQNNAKKSPAVQKARYPTRKPAQKPLGYR